jgi:CBS domain-containing protein
MSPRAACRLQTLGFTQVHDYMPGKVDWLARNLPIEGTGTNAPTIGRFLLDDVVVAAPEEAIADVRSRVAASPHSVALVTESGVLIGRLRASHLENTSGSSTAAAVMEPGPSTLRPHELSESTHARLTGKGLHYAIVTDPDGRLLGIVRPQDLA